MNAHVSNRATPDEQPKQAEIIAVLRRLAAPGSVLAVAHDMENAVVVTLAGPQTGRHIVPRHVAQMMALNDWIACDTPGSDALPDHCGGAGGFDPQRVAQRRDIWR